MSELTEEQNYFVLITEKEYENEFTNAEEKLFTSKADLMIALKKCKGSRFKIFTNHSDAIEFLNNNNNNAAEIVNNEINKQSNAEESPSLFRGPTPQDLTKFRRHIEAGRDEIIEELVWTNPRYLISSGDTPVILMEGPRYNAFHSAARYNQVNVIRFIYKTLNEKIFMRKLYPNDSELITQQRVERIIDLYLNTPDKAAGDTPLHFACKFGSKECVEQLLQFNCAINAINECEKLAEQVICDRKGDENVKECIKNLFRSRYFVPVYRDELNLEITIGQPCTQFNNGDERVKAIAGPMTPEQADNFYQILKSPAASANTELLHIRLSDHVKGVERIGRYLCREANVNWTEYWPFLNEKINICSSSGLQRFEQHLQSVYDDILVEISMAKEEERKGDITLLCEQLNDFRIHSFNGSLEMHSGDLNSDLYSDDEDDDDAFFTPPSSPSFISQTIDKSIEYYVKGNKYTQWDENVSLALMHTEIERHEYPFTHAWLQRVEYKRKNKYIEKENNGYNSKDTTPLINVKSPLSVVRLKDLRTPRRNRIDFDVT